MHNKVDAAWAARSNQICTFVLRKITENKTFKKSRCSQDRSSLPLTFTCLRPSFMALDSCLLPLSAYSPIQPDVSVTVLNKARVSKAFLIARLHLKHLINTVTRCNLFGYLYFSTTANRGSGVPDRQHRVLIRCSRGRQDS